MKSLVSQQHRFTDLYRPYPAFGVKNSNDCSDGLYESEDDETFMNSPISNPDSPFNIDELVTIDFSDLFNLQRQDQDDRKDELQVILEQVRRESLESIESLDSAGCNFTMMQPHPAELHPHHHNHHHHHPQQHLLMQHPPHPQQMPYPTPYEQVMYENIAYENAIYEATQPPTPPPKMQPPPQHHHNDEPTDKIRLYEFVLQLLNDNKTDCVRWLCPTEGEFEITNSSKIAQLWGKVKKNPTMTYEKFARALRHYYKLGILINYKHKEKLRYKFSQEILLKNKNSIKY